jgi:hypothetical protein
MLLQIDIDSTLYDADKLLTQLAEESNFKWPRRTNHWMGAFEVTHQDDTPCTVEEMKKLFRKAHSYEYVMEQKPYPHASSVLKQLVTDFPELEIAYVSDRNSQQTGALREWLENYDFLHSEGAHVQATKDKRHWMRERRPEIVIDDRVRTMLMARFELNSYVVSLEHNHNVNLRGEVDHIYIVKDWKEIDTVLRETIIPKVQEKAVSKEHELSYAR